MKYCSKCGCPLKDDDMYCTKCGSASDNHIDTSSHKYEYECDESSEAAATYSAFKQLLKICWRLIMALNIWGWFLWLIGCLVIIIISVLLSQPELFLNYEINLLIAIGITTLIGGYIYRFGKWLLKKN